MHNRTDLAEAKPGAKIKCLTCKLWPIVEGITKWASAEPLLKRTPNGGAVIVVRAGWVTLLVLLGSIAWAQWLDPSRTSTFSLDELRRALVANTTSMGVIFAAVYAALYARFASQWSYLAGLYNQIKEAETSSQPDSRWTHQVICDWKAGFITDAIAVHLACKYPFDGVIRSWAKDERVKGAFVCGNADEQEKWDDLILTLGGCQRCRRDETQSGQSNNP